MNRKRSIALRSAIVAAVLVMPSWAIAGGGPFVSKALDFNLTQPNHAVLTDVDTWRVTLGYRDKLVMDISYPSGRSTFLADCILVPTITDDTLNGTTCTNHHTTSQRKKSEQVFTAPAPGRWIVVFGTGSCSIGDRVKTGCNYNAAGDQDAYEVVPRVLTYTRMLLTGPTVVQAHHAAQVRGRLIGHSIAEQCFIGGQKVVLQSRSPSGWTTLARVFVDDDGVFHSHATPSKAGFYTIRAIYRGDPNHQPSAATYRFKVV